MKEEIKIAGSGGQGVLTLGVFLSRIGIVEGKKVSWLPSYGAEKRGGFSFCDVVVSDEEIYSPVIESPDTLILFDQRAHDLYGPKAESNTLIIENSSLVTEDKIEKGTKIKIPASEMAKNMKFIKAMNIIMAGAYIANRETFKKESAYKVMGEILKKKSEEILEKNIHAFDEGMDFVNKKTGMGGMVDNVKKWMNRKEEKKDK